MNKNFLMFIFLLSLSSCAINNEDIEIAQKACKYNGGLCEIINKKPIDDYLCKVIEIIYSNENIAVKLKDVIFPYDFEV